jgi:choline/glycine/proline betaine transport protein
MLMLAYGLVRQTNADLDGETISSESPAISERLKRLFVPASRAEIERQIASHGVPALQSVCQTMLEEGWADSAVKIDSEGASLTVSFGIDRLFTYRLLPRSRPLAAYTAWETPAAHRSRTWMLAARTGSEARHRDLTGFSEQQIAGDVLTQLERSRPVRGAASLGQDMVL